MYLKKGKRGYNHGGGSNTNPKVKKFKPLIKQKRKS